MKIIKTRNRTEIKISHLELRQLQDSGDLQLRECASEILELLQKKNYSRKESIDDEMLALYSSGINVAKKGNLLPNMNDKFDSGLSSEFKHNPIHYLFKSDKEIRQEEREKAWKEVDKEILELHGELEEAGVPLVVLAMLVAFQQIIYNKLIREEQKYD